MRSDFFLFICEKNIVNPIKPGLFRVRVDPGGQRCPRWNFPTFIINLLRSLLQKFQLTKLIIILIIHHELWWTTSQATAIWLVSLKIIFQRWYRWKGGFIFAKQQALGVGKDSFQNYLRLYCASFEGFVQCGKCLHIHCPYSDVIKYGSNHNWSSK